MKTRNWIALPLAALLSAGGACAQQDTGKALLDLLVKKGVITQQEADSLEQQVAAQQAATPAAAPSASSAAAAPMPENVVTYNHAHGPLSFRLGGTDITPFGFLDLTGVYRSSLVGSGIGTSFGSIPYSNTNGSTIGPVSETRFSAQNSRIGLRTDTDVGGGTSVMGYTEADFLGNAANNVTSVSNSNTLRMRVYFVDVKNGPWEFVAGQDWSMLTPNRKGISALPSDVFYTQDMDTNYQVGLVWARQPRISVIYHASDEWTLGLSAENPDAYVGSAVTLPTTNFNANQVDISAGSNSSGTTNANSIPDFVGKVAYDTKVGNLPFHAEAAGLLSQFRINTYANSGVINGNATAIAGSGEFNTGLTILPNVQLIETALYGAGAGRYLSTGLAPDFVVKPADASGVYGVSPVHSYAGIAGLEWNVTPATLLFGYYGLVHVSQDYYQNGSSYLGYGQPGGSNSQNRLIEEYTVGANHTFWKDPRYGALQLILQLSYLDREPWYVASGSPSKAENTLFYFDVRYVLP